MSDILGLPVAGYRATQPKEAIDLVNEFKVAEEKLLRKLDAMQANDAIDKRFLAIGRTQLEQAVMAINRSVFRPTRITLEGE